MKVSRNLSVPLWVVLLAILALASACVPAAPAPAASQPTAAPAPAATAGEASATGEAASLEGHWEGEIDIMGQKLPIQLDLSGQAGTIDFPTQGAKGIHLENFSAQGDAVHFEVLPAPRTAIFDGNAEGDKEQHAPDKARSPQLAGGGDKMCRIWLQVAGHDGPRRKVVRGVTPAWGNGKASVGYPSRLVISLALLS